MFGGLRNVMGKIISNVVGAVTTEELKPDKLDELLEPMLMDLVESDVAFDVAEAIIGKIKEKLVGAKTPRFSDKQRTIKELVKAALLDLLSDVPDVDFDDLLVARTRERRPVIIMFLGPNGYGKTTTMAKLAYRLLNRHRLTTVFAAADTFRAGAIEQVSEHANRLGIRVIAHTYGADPAAVAYDAVNHARSRGIHVVMIDTAGRMHTDKNLMAELQKIQRVVSPDFSVLVVDALLGNEAAEIAQHYSRYVHVDGLIATKVDAYPKGGSILTFLYLLRRPIYYMGTGQGYGDLTPFNKSDFISALLS